MVIENQLPAKRILPTPAQVGDLHGQKRRKKGTSVISEGMKAPDFNLPMADGGSINLAKLKGTPLVLYFYPKDDTSGCTAEARDFSQLNAEFENLGARVIGVSPDSIASHQRFRDKHELSVALASDTEKSAVEAYGVWVEKSMYGRKYMGVERSTFLIDRKGNIARVWRRVKVPGHAAEVLAAVKSLG